MNRHGRKACLLFSKQGSQREKRLIADASPFYAPGENAFLP